MGGAIGREILSSYSALNPTCVISDLVNDTVSPHWLNNRYTSAATILIQCGIMISGMLLNGFTVSVLIRVISNRPFYLLLLNLAAVDFCICVLSINFNILIGIFGLHNIILGTVIISVAKCASLRPSSSH